MPSQFTLPFLRHEQVARDAYSFFFDRTEATFDFRLGQYIRMVLPNEHADERGTSRFFTIASSPLEKEYLQITTRIIQSTFKKTLFALAPGSDVQFFGPLGNFVLKEDETSPHVFLAGGIGITPFLSMITYADQKKLTIPMTLFVSFSTRDEVIYYDKLKDIAKRNPSIKIVYTITHDENIKDWDGETGRINEGLIKKYVPAVSSAIYFVVGPQAMAEAMNTMVKEMGIPEDRIRHENFTGY